MADKIPVIIDGETIEVEEGSPLIEACFALGKMVPHYCYHSGLSVSGNCRMCMVEVEGMPKPVTACTTKVALQRNRETKELEPMRVHTESEQLADARAAIMEYLLINHPLDCPQCDQAGECHLQDYAYTYGHGHSRFTEEKTQRHTKDLGPNVKLYGNRCIACSRCVRFCDEIAGTGELTLVNRGDRNVIDVFPDIPLDNPLSMNVVDICPVGALLSKDFLFQARAWFMQATPTIAPNAHGDNVYVDTLDGDIKRLRARYNPDVNDWWIADRDRLNYQFVSRTERLTVPRVRGKDAEWSEALAIIATLLKDAAGDSLRVAVPAWASNEELFLLKEALGEIAHTGTGWGTPDQAPWRTPTGWTIPADTNPNRAGLNAVLGMEAADGALEGLAEAIEAGDVKALVVLGNVPNHVWPEALVSAAGKLDTLVVVDAWPSALADAATVVLPGAVPFEVDGSYVNTHGRVQRARAAVAPPGQARPLTEIIQQLRKALDDSAPAALSVGAVFKRMAEAVPAFSGLTWGGVGLAGAPLATADTRA